MPDGFGFDHLGRSNVVACIYCPTRGPLHAWPDGRRKRHARSHGSENRKAQEEARKERELILAGELLDG